MDRQVRTCSFCDKPAQLAITYRKAEPPPEKVKGEEHTVVRILRFCNVDHKLPE